MKEKSLASYYKNNSILNIVNSNGLKLKLEKLGARKVFVVHQGIDLDLWECHVGPKNKKLKIGCLYNNRHKTKRWSDFRKLASILGDKKYEYVGFGGTTCKDSFLSHFLTNPPATLLSQFYSSCDIWFAPSIKEGLHNVPMEAALCGCLILCNNHPENGMIHDYAFKNETAMVYKDISEACEMVKDPDWSLITPMAEFIQNEIGSREKNMEKFVNLFK